MHVRPVLGVSEERLLDHRRRPPLEQAEPQIPVGEGAKAIVEPVQVEDRPGQRQDPGRRPDRVRLEHGASERSGRCRLGDQLDAAVLVDDDGR